MWTSRLYVLENLFPQWTQLYSFFLVCTFTVSSYHHIFPCFVKMWKSRLYFREILFPQWTQLYSFFLVCTFTVSSYHHIFPCFVKMWKSRLYFREILFPQLTQVYNFSPVHVYSSTVSVYHHIICFVWTWTSRLYLRENLFPQWTQLYGFSPVCNPMYLFIRKPKGYTSEKICPSSHIYLCFVWIWTSRLYFRENLFPQWTQLYGFSPVCTLNVSVHQLNLSETHGLYFRENLFIITHLPMFCLNVNIKVVFPRKSVPTMITAIQCLSSMFIHCICLSSHLPMFCRNVNLKVVFPKKSGPTMNTAIGLLSSMYFQCICSSVKSKWNPRVILPRKAVHHHILCFVWIWTSRLYFRENLFPQWTQL